MLEGDKRFITPAPQTGKRERERERERQCKKDMEWYREKFKILKWVNSVEFTDKLVFDQKHGGY